MKVNIEKSRKYGNFFDFHELSMLVEGVDYGTIYVVDKGAEYAEAIKEALAKTYSSHAYHVMRMDFKVRVLPESNWPEEAFLKGKDFFTLVYTPDRLTHCYLTGAFDCLKHVESNLTWLMMEAHEISEKCAETAFVNLGDWDQDDGFDVDFEPEPRPNRSAISFRGKAQSKPDPTSFINTGENKNTKSPLTYAERIKKLRELPNIARRIRSAMDGAAKSAFAEVWKALTEREKGHLCFELLRHSRPKDVANIVGATIDREEMGERSRFTIVIKENPKDDLKSFDTRYKLCTYLRDPLGHLFPLKFSPVSQVLYTMSILNKKNHPTETPPLSMKDNAGAFKTIYHAMLDMERGADEKDYDSLFAHLTSDKSVHSGGLSGRYNEIETGLVKLFDELGENPLPYITRDDYPLAIAANNIEIPQVLTNVFIN